MESNTMNPSHRTTLSALMLTAFLLFAPHAVAESMSADAFRTALNTVASYAITEGEPQFTEELEALDAAIAASHGDAALRESYAEDLAAFLAHEDTGTDAKWWAARHLYRIAGREQVETIAPLLLDPGTSDIAVYALQTIPGEEATEALLEALKATSGETRIGIINALATRGDAAALPVLKPLAQILTVAGATLYSDLEHAEVNAALHAIAKIDSDEAEAALRSRLEEIRQDPRLSDAPHHYFLSYMHAYFVQLAARYDQDSLAEFVFALVPLNQLSPPEHIRVGTTLAMIRQAVRAEHHPQEMIEHPDTPRDVKLTYLWELEDPDILAKLAEYAHEMPRNFQAVALEVLAEWGDGRAAPAAAELLGSTDEEVSIAALNALGRVGNAEHIPVLLTYASGPSGAQTRAATQALTRLRGEAIDDALMAQVGRGASSLRIASIRALVARQSVAAMDTFWEATTAEPSPVRTAAFEALEAMGGPDTAIRIAAGFREMRHEETRDAALKSVVTLAHRTGTQAEVARALVENIEEDEDANVLSVLEALGRLDDPAALPHLMDAVRSENSTVQLTAIRALFDWPSADPLDPLLDYAAEEDEGLQKALALRAAASMVNKLPGEDEQLAAYRRLLAFELPAQEMRRILSGLSRLESHDALALAETYLEDEELGNDAAFAVAGIWTNILSPSASHNADTAASAMDGNENTRWTTGELQHPDQWYQLSPTRPVTVRALELNAGASAGDYPRGYAVRVSEDGEEWSEPIASGTGSEALTRIEFEPVTTSFLRIELTATADENFWSIHTLEVEIDE